MKGRDMKQCVFKKAAVILAYPDDKMLWAGGVILMHPEINWTILALCKIDDSERSSKFRKVVKALGAKGIMADLDDGPRSNPIDYQEMQYAISELLTASNYDLIITHGCGKEYTGHRRGEEVAAAVMSLWRREKLNAKEIWRFAYNDVDRRRLPTVFEDADLIIKVPRKIRLEKFNIITKICGFAPGSFKAKTARKREAFWRISKRTADITG